MRNAWQWLVFAIIAFTVFYQIFFALDSNSCSRDHLLKSRHQSLVKILLQSLVFIFGGLSTFVGWGHQCPTVPAVFYPALLPARGQQEGGGEEEGSLSFSGESSVGVEVACLHLSSLASLTPPPQPWWQLGRGLLRRYIKQVCSVVQTTEKLTDQSALIMI